jgi:hypothetical protein
MAEEHKSETWKTGEGRLTLAAAGASALALLTDNVQALSLDPWERRIVLVGVFAQACALTIARGLAKTQPPRPS